MNYDLLLKEHHLKVTPQRLGILKLMHVTGHISIEDLYESIKKQFSSISLATLYKNINSMLETSLIKEVKAPYVKARYEISKEPHAHLVCTECGEFQDVMFSVDKIAQSIASNNNFNVNDTSLIISGTCPKCQ
ncbi:MAG: Fur family transcriptional regulator [Campylobacterota bacterium]|nr:Fur family transcriptional regulator [Campylobacterota bacterium]